MNALPPLSSVHIWYIITQYRHIYRKIGKEREVDLRENVGSQIF